MSGPHGVCGLGEGLFVLCNQSQLYFHNLTQSTACSKCRLSSATSTPCPQPCVWCSPSGFRVRLKKFTIESKVVRSFQFVGSLPQTKHFKCLGVMFTSDGRMELEKDQWIWGNERFAQVFCLKEGVESKRQSS